MSLSKYSGKKVAILGFAREGRSTYNYLKNSGADITILDAKPLDPPQQGVRQVIGKDYLKDLDSYDLIFRTPGILPTALATKAKVTSLTNDFLELCPATVVGVTGTKGKGTVASLTLHILEAVDKKVYLGGNIGTPPLDFLPQLSKEDVVVLELSDLQLWDIEHSPRIAVLLAITPEHLDWHPSFEHYVSSKANITKFQTAQDKLVFNAKNEVSKKIAQSSQALLMPFPDRNGAWVDGATIKLKDQVICQTSEVKLLGEHNHDNICAALTAVSLFSNDITAIANALKSYQPLEHRLEFVKEVNGVSYYNDSIGTTPEAAAAAVKAISNPKIIIAGGSDKGLEYQVFAEAIATDNVRTIILVGETADKIAATLKKAKFPATKVKQITQSELANEPMKRLVGLASELARPGDAVILAPASASFDLFKNYDDRGKKFKQAVSLL